MQGYLKKIHTGVIAYTTHVRVQCAKELTVVVLFRAPRLPTVEVFLYLILNLLETQCINLVPTVNMIER